MVGLPPISWRKSSYSAQNGNCVEVARCNAGNQGIGDTIAIRDSKHPERERLTVSRSDFTRFSQLVKQQF